MDNSKLRKDFESRLDGRSFSELPPELVKTYELHRIADALEELNSKMERLLGAVWHRSSRG